MDITIIGAGSMARGIATRALAGGHSVTVLGSKAGELSGDVRAGAVGDPLTGDVVVLAVPYGALGDVLGTYEGQLAGKVVVDITNPLDFASFSPLAVDAGSAAQEIAQKAPEAKVVKASTRRSPARWSRAASLTRRSTSSSPPTTRTPSAPSGRSPRTAGCALSMPGRSPAPASSRRWATCTWRCSSRSARASGAPSRSCPDGQAGESLAPSFLIRPSDWSLRTTR
jgi:NADP oxidoreductase coenzyme F420-dependent